MPSTGQISCAHAFEVDESYTVSQINILLFLLKERVPDEILCEFHAINATLCIYLASWCENNNDDDTYHI